MNILDMEESKKNFIESSKIDDIETNNFNNAKDESYFPYLLGSKKAYLGSLIHSGSKMLNMYEQKINAYTKIGDFIIWELLSFALCVVCFLSKFRANDESLSNEVSYFRYAKYVPGVGLIMRNRSFSTVIVFLILFAIYFTGFGLKEKDLLSLGMYDDFKIYFLGILGILTSLTIFSGLNALDIYKDDSDIE